MKKQIKSHPKGEPRMQPYSHSRTGSTLLVVSVLLTAAAIVAASVIPGREAGDLNRKIYSTINKLDKVDALPERVADQWFRHGIISGVKSKRHSCECYTNGSFF
jgi:hypothetical protein